MAWDGLEIAPFCGDNHGGVLYRGETRPRNVVDAMSVFFSFFFAIHLIKLLLL